MMNKRQKIFDLLSRCDSPLLVSEVAEKLLIDNNYCQYVLSTSFGAVKGLKRIGNPRKYRYYFVKQTTNKEVKEEIPPKIKSEPPAQEEIKAKATEAEVTKSLLEQIDLDLLADMIADRLVDKLSERLGIKGDDRGPLPKIEIERKKKLKTVTVAGLLPNQAGMIQEEFSSKFDMRFWTKDQSAQQLKVMAKRSDHVIAFVSKMGHWADRILSENSTEYTRVSGGMTQVRECLKSLNGVQ